MEIRRRPSFTASIGANQRFGSARGLTKEIDNLGLKGKSLCVKLTQDILPPQQQH
ncbi:unnamed protein product [Rodentolepis nana]|uniref:Uncharacterized protein n=1 Tax=Rodentolepis nana TaxID=102285 RepID=A0A3P7SMA3_RODNA|nr:unnamed protein product [Rodentolepis nana]